MPSVSDLKPESLTGPGPADVLDRACGAMLGLALGDALGATVEFMTPLEIRAAHGVHNEITGGGWLRLRRGQVTDDTTMCFALAEAWLAAPEPPGAQRCAEAFDAWMRAKPVDIGNTVRRGIVHFRRTGETAVPPSSDAGNGAAMRCLPVALALLGAPDAVLASASITQAHVTHHNVLSDAACLCLLRMLQAALRGDNLVQLLGFADVLVESEGCFAFRGRRCENPSGYIVDTMQAVLQGLREYGEDFESCVVDVVNRGGDADTTGAIVGMLAGALAGASALPVRWLDALEPDVRARCNSYAERLIERSPWWREHAGQIAASELSTRPDA